MDVDIDTPTSFDPRTVFPGIVRASQLQKGRLVKHPCGVYFQNIGLDPISDVSPIPHKDAEECGYTKIDFLHLSVLDNIPSKRVQREILAREVDWDMLLDEDIVARLVHIHAHGALVNQIQPTNIESLGDCLALIRPGKKHLLTQYLADPELVRDLWLYTKPADGSYYFKKSHAIAYAMVIVMQLNTIKYGVSS